MVINNQIIFDNTNRDLALIMFAVCLVLIIGAKIHETYYLKNHN
jgi:hypothetical protein